MSKPHSRPTPRIHHHRNLSTQLTISIIIRTKNRPHLLTRSLQSLAEQRRLPDQIVIVNDGGKAVDAVIQNFTHLNVQIIDNEVNQGRARAGNLGVQAANGNFIGFLDDDDRYLPDHLERLEKTLLHFDAQIAYSGCRLLERDTLGDVPVLQEKPIGQYNEPFDAQRLWYENYIPIINLLINRQLWLAVGGFDEGFEIFEDWDILLRLSQKTNFYHVNRLTTEYAVWGSEQITRTEDEQYWQYAYRRFLQKHILTLPARQQLNLLTRYWIVSQARRGRISTTQESVEQLQLRLLQQQQSFEQKTQRLSELEQELLNLRQNYTNHCNAYEKDLTEKKKQYEKLQQAHDDSERHYRKQYQELEQARNHQIQALQAEHQQARQALQTHYQTQYAALEQQHETLSQQYENISQQYTDLQQAYQALESKYDALKKLAEKQQQRLTELENSLIEMSKQLQVGLGERVYYTQLSYAIATDQGGVFEDYHRLIDWIMSKIEEFRLLEQQALNQRQILSESFQTLRQQITDLTHLISGSHWHWVRRYAGAVQAIDKRIAQLFVQTESVLETHSHFLDKLGLSPLFHPQFTTELPPPRSLSPYYPVFASFAGTEDNPQLMENVRALGETPFLLEPEAVLVFSIYCPKNDFFRLDLLLGTRLRINPCHVRIIIRALTDMQIVRVAYLDAMSVFDNRFQPVRFPPITDSAGQSYQIEIDSPDASERAGIAIWCHEKYPFVVETPSLSDITIRCSPQTLPLWVQQGLLDLPLSPRLHSNQPQHFFFLTGIQFSTALLVLHQYLQRLGQALEHSQQTANVIVSGEMSPTLQRYCQQFDFTTIPSLSLTDRLSWLQKQSQGEYGWLLELSALPTVDSIERLLEVKDSEPNVGMVVPLEIQVEGKIYAAYALMQREGVIYPAADSAPADHPYHGYRRQVDATTSCLMTIRLAALQNVDLSFLNDYQTAIYQLAELIWQLKTQDYPTIYESALQYTQEAEVKIIAEDAYHLDCQNFYQRWQEKLPVYPAVYNHFEMLLNPEQAPTVLIIEPTLPAYDQDSGSLRLFTLLKMWRELGYRLTFFPDNLDSQFKYRHALEALGIEVFHYPLHDALAYRRFDYALVCRVDMGQRYINHLRLTSPRTHILYDTVDVHYIREERQAAIEQSEELAAKAQRTKRAELANCIAADCTLTVTEQDSQYLRQQIPNLNCFVLPNVHSVPPLAAESFEQRQGLVFIGNYNHPPNEDAVYYFIDNVLPKIREKIPDIKFYVVGSHLKEDMQQLASEQVEIVGWVEEVPPEFAKRRVFVSYLRYGGGMKGKIGQALALGLPTVNTTISAEGIGLVDGETALIADDPDSFADAVYRLYTDETLWQKIATRGHQFIADQYGEEAIRSRLKQLLQQEKPYQ